jgi:small-conductance mechanosensitive channel
MGSVEMQKAVWSIWYDIVNARDPGIAGQLRAPLDGYRRTVLALDNSMRTSFRHTLAEAADAERAAISFAADQEASFLRARAATLRERAGWEGRLIADLISIQDLLDRWRAEFVSEAKGRDYLDFEVWRYRIATFAMSLWSLELFSAEDTIEVDGRKITAERSITLGKVVSAIIILALGLLLGRALIDVACRFAVRYLRCEENATRLAGKWVFALLAAVLFLLSLTTVKIPFTVFAFLGGAVAIGLGFGMQTLLKNLISGLMLLVERPFRLGDVVEVGSIRGTVTDINVRSSLIRDANGIETLVPNSTFLEQNVTNWTYTSSRVRYSLKIGAAYGSRAELVRELLLAVARHHPLVLRNPEPEVLLDDFGADALMFSLLFWLDIGGKTDSRTVGSELRFAIESEFTAAGIVLAYPQRDVHLDAAKPIPVRVVGEPATPAVKAAHEALPTQPVV